MTTAPRAVLVLLLSTLLTAPLCAAKHKHPFRQLPEDSKAEAPTDFQFLPKSWGPIHSVVPKYPSDHLVNRQEGYTLGWVRFGSDGCAQRVEIPVQHGDPQFIQAAIPTFVSMRVVVPPGQTGPWWHFTWVTFRISGGREPSWAKQIFALNPDKNTGREWRRLKRENTALLKQACPEVEVLVAPPISEAK